MQSLARLRGSARQSAIRGLLHAIERGDCADFEFLADQLTQDERFALFYRDELVSGARAFLSMDLCASNYLQCERLWRLCPDEIAFTRVSFALHGSHNVQLLLSFLRRFDALHFRSSSRVLEWAPWLNKDVPAKDEARDWLVHCAEFIAQSATRLPVPPYRDAVDSRFECASAAFARRILWRVVRSQNDDLDANLDLLCASPALLTCIQKILLECDDDLLAQRFLLDALLGAGYNAHIMLRHHVLTSSNLHTMIGRHLSFRFIRSGPLEPEWALKIVWRDKELFECPTTTVSCHSIVGDKLTALCSLGLRPTNRGGSQLLLHSSFRCQAQTAWAEHRSRVMSADEWQVLCHEAWPDDQFIDVPDDVFVLLASFV